MIELQLKGLGSNDERFINLDPNRVESVEDDQDEAGSIVVMNSGTTHRVTASRKTVLSLVEGAKT